jgi:ectoine hydroxylase
MQLTEAQVTEYRAKGYILLPAVLGAAELAALEAAMLAVTRRQGPEVAREPDGRPHVVYGMHLWDPRFGALARHPKILPAVEQLLGQQAYVHQSRVNVKQRDGSIVAWHQDWGTYHRVDGIPRPDGIMIGIYLDDVTACNAPILAVPGSHAQGLVSEARIDPSVPDAGQAAKHRFDITPETMQRLVARHGIEALTGPAGSVLLMNMAVVHGSSINISPLRRVILYVNVSAIDNRGESFRRPEYQAARDFAPLTVLTEDCLTRAQ